MIEIRHLTKQTNDVYEWTNRFLQSIPFDKWDTIPEVLDTSVNWQVGHLIVSHYYHSIWVIRGMQIDIAKALPLKNYGDHFTNAAAKQGQRKFNAEELFSHLQLMQSKSIECISGLNEEDLDAALEPTGFPHPVAKTKREAIEWNIHHTMYHSGQIGILNRIVNKRFDFGLRK